MQGRGLEGRGFSPAVSLRKKGALAPEAKHLDRELTRVRAHEPLQIGIS